MHVANIEQLQADKERFIEDVGMLFEDFSHPRMAGRIIGYLLICDPPHQTAGEILAAVGGSKGSISSMTRLLIQMGQVERISIFGKRKTYYRIKSGLQPELLPSKMGFLKSMHEMAERGLTLIDDNNIQQRQRLQQIRDFSAFVEHNLSNLLETWKKENLKM